MKRWILSFTLVFLLVLTSWAQTTGTISYGETVMGNITDEDPVHRWIFEGSAGDVIHIRMTATNLAEGNLDSYLILLDENEEVLAENDDASEVTIDAAIENFEVPADGTYTIQASRFGFESGLVTGEYELSLTLAGDEELPSPTQEATAEPEPSADSQMYTGTLNRTSFEERWSFDGTEGEILTIRMERTSGDLDTYVRLLDENDRELASNDDAENSTTVSEITNFELPYTGTYTAVATRFGFESGTSSGDYTLTISGETTPFIPEPTEEVTPVPSEEVTPVPTEEVTPVPTEEVTPEPTEEVTPLPNPTIEPTPNLGLPTDTFIPVAVGEFVNGEISVGDEIDFYQFGGQAGDLVTISLKKVSGDLNPSLTLLNGENEVLEVNQDFNGPADSRISNYVLPTTGTYAISARSENGQTGAYVLYLFVSGTREVPAQTDSIAPIAPLSGAELAFTLAWTGTADFDLAVIAPDGTRIDFASNGAGGIFGGDANGGCNESQTNPNESVFWESAAPTGNYQIEVAYVFPCGGEGAVSYVLTVQKGGEIVETLSGELTEGDLETYDVTMD